jgi:hypothetical protein
LILIIFQVGLILYFRHTDDGLHQDTAGSVAYCTFTLTVGTEEILCIPFAPVIGVLGAQITLGVKNNLGASVLAQLIDLNIRALAKSN